MSAFIWSHVFGHLKCPVFTLSLVVLLSIAARKKNPSRLFRLIVQGCPAPDPWCHLYLQHVEEL